MKRSIIVIALLVSECVVFGQAPKTNWADSLRYSYMPKTIVMALTSSLGNDPVKASSVVEAIKNKQYADQSIEKGKKWLANTYSSADKVGIKVRDDSSYVYPMLIDYKQGKAIMLRNFVSKYVYNSNNLSTPRKRAEHAVDDMFLPLIYEIINDKVIIDQPYVGFTFVYSYKDFSDKYALSWGGSITVITPTADFKKLQQFQITEDEFVKQCDFYMIERGNAVKFQYTIK